jgi:hypothetical protein
VFPIVQVDPAKIVRDEQLGSKSKFWYDNDQGERWLFKETREIIPGESTGEDWAEKLAAEIAAVVGISAARVELAEFQQRRGSSSKLFLGSENESLVHGNEILAGSIIGYDRKKRLHQHDHTLDNIVLALETILPGQPGLRISILRQLAGCLVLDALIGNTDRHHENWGIIYSADGPSTAATGNADRHDENWRVVYSAERARTALSLVAAPSFDHASSLGRELLDARRAEILQQKRMESYVRGGRGGIYIRKSDKKGANPVELVKYGLRKYPGLFRPALAKVAGAPIEKLYSPVDEVPRSRMTEVACQFAKEFLRCSHHQLSQL